MKTEKIIVIAAMGLGAYLLLKNKTTTPLVYRPTTGQPAGYPLTPGGTRAAQIDALAGAIPAIKNLWGSLTGAISGNNSNAGSYGGMAGTVAANTPYYSDADMAWRDQEALAELAAGSATDTYAINMPESTVSYEADWSW